VSTGRLTEAGQFDDPGIKGMVIPEHLINAEFDEIIKRKKLLTGDLKLSGALDSKKSQKNKPANSKEGLIKASAAYKLLTAKYMEMTPERNTMQEISNMYNQIKKAGQHMYKKTQEFYGPEDAPPPRPLPMSPEQRFGADDSEGTPPPPPVKRN
jgi:hypothetical protein